MANCPTCKIRLQTVRQREGIYYSCIQCNGRAVTMPQIRRMTGDRFATGLMKKVSKATEASRWTCPFCQAPMKSFEVTDPPLTLDSCKPCVVIWFEAGKFEELPEGVVESPEQAMLVAAEAEAKWKIEQQSARSQAYTRGPPDEWWKWIPALIGLPVKYFNAGTAGRPWATWSLSTLIVLVSVLAFSNLQASVDTFGLIPAKAWRYGGVTFLTSFFLHGGIWHLVGNLYFFLLFGGEVEDFLGWWRFLVLIFLSAFVGDVFHILGEPRSNLPSIGASGGISGVLVFYACQFPGARLGIFWWRFGWIQLPALGAFVLWFLLQLLTLWEQVHGFSNVSALAHMGGVTTGFVFWFFWKKRERKALEA